MSIEEYIEVVSGMKYVIEQFVSHPAARYEDHSLVQSVHTLQNYADLVATHLHDTLKTNESIDDTRVQSATMMQLFREQCAAQHRKTPTIWIYRKGQQSILESMFTHSFDSVLDIESSVWERTLTRLLMWLATEDQLYPVLQRLETMLGSIITTERRVKIKDAQILIGAHLLLAFDRTAEQFNYRHDVPLQWQTPMLMNKFIEEIYNDTAFEYVYTTLRVAHSF